MLYFIESKITKTRNNLDLDAKHFKLVKYGLKCCNLAEIRVPHLAAGCNHLHN